MGAKRKAGASVGVGCQAIPDQASVATDALGFTLGCGGVFGRVGSVSFKSMWLPSNTAGNKETEPRGLPAAIPGCVGMLSWKGHGHKRATLAHQLGDVWVWPVLVVPAASTTTTIASTATGASTSATLTSPNRT